MLIASSQEQNKQFRLRDWMNKCNVIIFDERD